jgi:sugar O-acyltransferase (sialic acid O-acetyltransferase NeuD family)
MSQRLFIVGTRSFAAEVLDFARAAGLAPAGLLEASDSSRPGTTIHGLPVDWLDDFEPAPEDSAVVGTGDTDRREVTERLRARGWKLARLVHPAAHVSETSEVGDGAIVGPGVVVGAMSTIGGGAVIGRGALVGHHATIEELATLSPGANVAGNTVVAAGAFIGMGASVRDHVRVGAGAVVGMGAVVVGDVADGVEVRGVPARPVSAKKRAPAT